MAHLLLRVAELLWQLAVSVPAAASEVTSSTRQHLTEFADVPSASILGHSGSHVALSFDHDSTNAYGNLGQWVLTKRQPSSDNTSAKDIGDHALVLIDNITAIAKPKFVSLECKERQVDFERVQPFITNSLRNASFRKRRCGKREIRCGRIVLDKAIDDDVLAEAYDYRNNLASWEGLDIIKEMLEKYFKTGELTPTGGQLDHNIRSELPCELHADYLSRPPYYFLTAIIYLVDQGRDCSPCETIFNDSVEQGIFSKGHIVQPKRGRVVLFSGGMENMHCKMPSSGKRDVVQLWFRCASEAKRSLEL